MPEQPEAQQFRLAYVPGVMPAKWVRTWTERIPDVPLELVSLDTAGALAAINAQEVDAGLLRLPIERDGLHAIPLYTEATVVIMPKDHALTLAEELSLADLDGETVLHPQDDSLRWDAAPGQALPGTPALERPATTQAAVDLVLAGIGVVIAPQSMARLHHHKDLVFRPLAEAPTSQVALVWREDAGTDLMEELIGIVRGRTANSSRGTRAQADEVKLRPTEKAKAKAREKARAQGAPPAGRGRQGGKGNQRGPAKGGGPNGGKGGGGKSGGKGGGKGRKPR